MVSAISNYTPNMALASPVQMVKNLKFISLPLIAVAGSYLAPTAQADNRSIMECYRDCDEHRDALPILILLCKLACNIFCD